MGCIKCDKYHKSTSNSLQFTAMRRITDSRDKTNMALPFFETIESNALGAEVTGNNTALYALDGSSLQRSFLLDEAIHVVQLWTYPRPGMLDLTSVASIRTFSEATGDELAEWSMIGSSHFHDHGYVQADFQPKGSIGNQNRGWVRIPEELEGRALFAEPLAMPRSMEPVTLPEEISNRVNAVASQTGYLAIVR